MPDITLYQEDIAILAELAKRQYHKLQIRYNRLALRGASEQDLKLASWEANNMAEIFTVLNIRAGQQSENCNHPPIATAHARGKGKPAFFAA